MAVKMVNVKLNKRLICDGKFRMAGYEGQMDENRANYLGGLGEIEILGVAKKAAGKKKAAKEDTDAEDLGLADEPDAA